MSKLNFFEISREFFDSMYSPLYDNEEYNQNDYFLEILSDEENQMIEEEDDLDIEECQCNLCYILSNIFPSKKKVL